ARLEPHLDAVEQLRQQPLGDVRLRALDAPERDAVVVGDPLVEAPREAAEDARVADVRPRETAGDHAADVTAGLDEHRPRAGLGGADRRRDPGPGGAVDGDVGHTNGSSSATAEAASTPSSSASTSSGTVEGSGFSVM